MNKIRNSNIELLRILMMLVIIAHHYITDNTGIIGAINLYDSKLLFSPKVALTLCIGGGGKCAVNVFLLITGYFTCTQNFKWKKVLDLCLQTIFYYGLIYFIFLAFGIESFSIKQLYKILFHLPFYFGESFISCYVALYLLSPFINKLINACNKKELTLLIVILLLLQTVFSTFFLNEYFDAIGWYSTVYIIGAYIRLYSNDFMKSKKITGILCTFSIIFSWITIIGILFLTVVFSLEAEY